MRKIVKYKAVDNTEFDFEKDCLEYEYLIKRVKAIMKVLPKLPENDGCSFSNGGGYIQHDRATLRKVKLELLEQIKKYVNHDWVQQTIDNENTHSSWVARLLDDYNIRPLRSAWYRFSCIDDLDREWGQPYYALNPTEGKQICINPAYKNKHEKI